MLHTIPSLEFGLQAQISSAVHQYTPAPTPSAGTAFPVHVVAARVKVVNTLVLASDLHHHGYHFSL